MERASAQLESFLSEEHAELLEWFFGPGLGTFARSTSGAIIERLQMFSFGSDPCDACNGTGFKGGWSYGDEAERQKKNLTRTEELAELIGLHPNVLTPVPPPPATAKRKDQDPDARCHPCRGSGVRSRTSRRRLRGAITARPKPSTGHGGGYLPSDFALQHYAIACRRLDVVSASNPRAAAVLEAFYGDWGARWADTVEGRLFAVYAFTPAGHKLLRMSQDKAQLENGELRPDEVLGVEFSLQRTQPNRQRGDLFTAAREQAKRILGEACRAWNASDAEMHRWRLEREEARKKEIRDLRIREILAAAEAVELPALVSGIDGVYEELIDEANREISRLLLCPSDIVGTTEAAS